MSIEGEGHVHPQARMDNASGKHREAFVVDFRDAKGQRTIKTFATEKEARAFRGKVEQPGHKHVAPRSTPTVREAADRWLLAVEHGARRGMTEPVEAATLRQYTYHVRQYIEPQLGSEKVPPRSPRRWCSEFRDRLLRKLSRGMARKVVHTLKAILVEADYQRRCAQRDGRQGQQAAQGAGR